MREGHWSSDARTLPIHSSNFLLQFTWLFPKYLSLLHVWGNISLFGRLLFVTFLNHETSHDWTIFIVLVRFNKAFSHKLSWITLNKLDGLFFTGRRLEHCLVIFYLKKEDLNLILDRWRSSKMSELQLEPESHKTSSSNSVDIFRHISQGTLPSNLTNKFVHNCLSWDHPMENERQSNQNLFSVTQVNEIIPAGLNL